MSVGRSPTEIFWESEFFYRKFVKKVFEVGGPKNRLFWAYFQKLMSEISTGLEKVCFLRPRFYRKIEEMGSYFLGCAPNYFLQKLMNVAHFLCKTRKVVGPYFSLIFLTQNGRTVLLTIFLRAKKWLFRAKILSVPDPKTTCISDSFFWFLLSENIVTKTKTKQTLGEAVQKTRWLFCNTTGNNFPASMKLTQP